MAETVEPPLRRPPPPGFRYRTFATASDFLAAARTFLLEDEARNNLILSLAERLASGPIESSENPVFAVVDDQTGVALAALRTPPQNLVLSAVRDRGALRILATELYALIPYLPGVNATAADGGHFAEEWQRLSGRRGRVHRHERIYQLDRVEVVPETHRAIRPATHEDRALLVDWLGGFASEALGVEPDAVELERAVTAQLGNDSTRAVAYFIWDDGGGPVALAGLSGHTPNGVRVSAVWTPTEHRRHGYATALVARLSQTALDSGRRFCFLYTDRANPISNRIYQRIGYRPVCEAENWLFDNPD
jgi:predicted GNAT family acetyltransferase